jgi:hypothetical protein
MIAIKSVKRSIISQLVSILLKVRFIPVKIDHQRKRVTIKLCSVVTLTCFIIHWGLFLLINMPVNIAAHQVRYVVVEYFEKTNVIDAISQFLFGSFMGVLFPFCPVFLAMGLPAIPSIALAIDLNWPRNGVKNVFSFFMIAFGAFLINATFWNNNLEEENVQTHIKILLYFSPSNFIAPLYWILPILLVSSWMEKFISICESNDKGKEIPRARRCIELYTAFQEGFGTFFFFVFSVTQLLSIFTLFLTISQSIGSDDTLAVKLLHSLGNLVVTSGLILNITGLTFILETGYKSLTGLAKPLQEQLIQQMDGSERRIIKNTIKDLEQMQPLTGNGYFAITRGTLTAMVSVSITYIIILVQFKMSAT